MPSALGSRLTAGMAGAAFLLDALACFEACGVVCGCWALAVVVRSTRSTPNISSSAQPMSSDRIFTANDDGRNRGNFLAVIMVLDRIRTAYWRPHPRLDAARWLHRPSPAVVQIRVRTDKDACSWLSPCLD